MTIGRLTELLEAQVLCGAEDPEEEIPNVFAGDMMSDILACPEEIALMLTGLANQQVIRTADMMDIGAIVFVRGKQPAGDLIAMARERGMTVLLTQKGMYESCGLLYGAGLEGAFR